MRFFTRTAPPLLALYVLLSGKALPAENEMPIVPFRVEIPGAALEDLRGRLANTRLPDQIPDTS